MLDTKNQPHFLRSETVPIAADETSAAELLANALGVVRRQVFVVFGFALLGVALGGIYLALASPKYTATAKLLVDTRKMELIQQPAVYDEASIQSIGAMESQVELLRSDEVALRVIRKLNLAEDPRFIGDSVESVVRSLLHRVAPGYFGEPPALSEDERQSSARELFAKSLSVDAGWRDLCNGNRL